MKFCPCCKKLRFCFELEVMPSKIAELNDLANQCQQDIDMESTHLEPLKVKADKWSEAVNKAYYNGGYLDEDEDMTGRYWEYQKYRDKQSVVLTELNSLTHKIQQLNAQLEAIKQLANRLKQYCTFCTYCIEKVITSEIRGYYIEGNWVQEVSTIKHQADLKRKETNTQFYHHIQNFLVLTCGAHPNWDYELINMVSSDLEDESYDYYIEDCFVQNPLRVTWLTECKFKMVMQCIKMGGNALINMNYAVSKNQFLDIRMLTATAIKIKPSASFKLSDTILDSITALERLWDEA
jgi:hypothetical protein